MMSQSKTLEANKRLITIENGFHDLFDNEGTKCLEYIIEWLTDRLENENQTDF